MVAARGSCERMNDALNAATTHTTHCPRRRSASRAHRPGWCCPAAPSLSRSSQSLGPVLSAVEQVVRREDAVSADVLDELRGGQAGLDRQARRSRNAELVIEE